MGPQSESKRLILKTKQNLSLVRPLVTRLRAYVPGEQPRIKGLIKLNTNENPYPPSPKVLRSVRQAADGRLRLYPSPAADGLRAKLAEYHDCTPENIIVGNGSDELLAMAVRAFVEPAFGPSEQRKPPSQTFVQYFTPSYSLYPVLADIHGANKSAIPLCEDFGLPSAKELRIGGRWDPAAALTFITTPNAPSGRGYDTGELARLCKSTKGVVVLDEAYVDFAENNSMELAMSLSNVLVARTFSKAYSLCFQRVGYFVGPVDLISALQKIRDSYNVNGLGQIAAEASLDDLRYYQANFRKIIRTRESLRHSLARLGFSCAPSQTNFILVKPPKFPASEWLHKLRQRKILVRWFDQAEVRNYLRITIGTPEEAAALVEAVRQILKV